MNKTEENLKRELQIAEIINRARNLNNKMEVKNGKNR